MAIIRGARPSDNFVMIHNAALADERLSYKARGLLAYMLSRPPGWATSAERLASTSPKEGRDAVLSGLKELETIGYLHRKMTSGGRGKWSHDQYVTDEPYLDGEPSKDKEVIATGLDDSVNYDSVKPVDTSKTDSNKTEINNTDPSVLQDISSTSPVEIPEQARDYLTPDGMELAMPIIEQAGLDLNEVVQHFNDSKYYHGIPRYEYFQHWVRMEALCKREGRPLPGLDVIPTPKDVDEAFQMFWDAYPKKERRPIALAAFKAAVKKTHPITIIRQAMGYARKVERDHKEDQFIAGPAQWLNDERWTDKYPEPVRDLSRTAADY